jgi:drug/metabolite transporter (DMT)-like permease
MCALAYGVSDFVGGFASRRVPALRIVLLSYPVAMVALTAVAALVGGHVTTPAVVYGFLAGVSSAFGVWWFYAALGAGPISVVSPLTAILVAGVPVISGVVLGERPTALAYAGIAVALVAVFLVSRDTTDEDAQPHRFTKTVAWLTVGSGLAFGLNFVLMHQTPVDSGLWPVVFGRIASTSVIIVAAAVSGNLHLPTGQARKLALTAAVLDTVANVTMLLALHASLLSLASVLISLYPAATVALAVVVLKERVTRSQLVGMVLALVSVAMIAGAFPG